MFTDITWSERRMKNWRNISTPPQYQPTDILITVNDNEILLIPNNQTKPIYSFCDWDIDSDDEIDDDSDDDDISSSLLFNDI